MELPSGSAEEVEIRAATVQSVEQIRTCLESTHGIHIRSLDLDLMLWQTGHDLRAHLKPHHRTLTIYY